MKARDKVPKILPCHTCITLAMCLGKSFSGLFETCPILIEWFKKSEKYNESSM